MYHQHAATEIKLQSVNMTMELSCETLSCGGKAALTKNQSQKQIFKSILCAMAILNCNL